MREIRALVREDEALQKDLRQTHRAHGLYPQDGGYLAKALWWYNHAWSDDIAWAAAYGNLVEIPPQQFKINAEFEGREIDIMVTHVANRIQGADGVRCAIDPSRFITACGIITPLAIAARLLCTPYIFIPLNIAQRILVYSASTIYVARRYQQYRYPTMLKDKKGVARYLHKIIPDLAEGVEQVMAGGIYGIWL
ncbi:hypothetical protein OH77DRAFT_1427642 [Trametes cingulata]|nr:hypothetical protein OH77DRAFT_1427642 [Trametes cingulata]